MREGGAHCQLACFWAGRWYKPKLLFTQDVDEIPTPDPDEVYIVYCDMCEDFLDRQVATKVCTRQGRGGGMPAVRLTAVCVLVGAVL